MSINASSGRRAWAPVLAGIGLSLALLLLSGCSSQATTSEPAAGAPGLTEELDTYAQSFETLLTDRALAETLPFAVVPGEGLSWLSEAARPLTIAGLKGYRLANGDTVVLFLTPLDVSPATTDRERLEACRAVSESVWAAMEGKYPEMFEKDVGFEEGDGFLAWYFILSGQQDEDYVDQLHALVETARERLLDVSDRD